MCISQGYTGGDEGVRRSENAFVAVLLVLFSFHAVVLDCRAAFRTPSANSAACKIHEILLVFASAFTFVTELEMGIE